MRRRNLLALLAGGMGFVAGCSSRSHPEGTTESAPGTTSAAELSAETPTTGENTTTIVVGPDGSDANPGTESEPLESIQYAIDRARPGDEIAVRAGEYVERFRTKRSGDPDAQITITGPRDAVVRPPNNDLNGRLFDVNHSHVHLTGLTFDGLADPSRPTDPTQYVDTIVECRPVDWAGYSGTYLTDVKIMPHAIGNARRAMIQHIRTNQFEAGEFEVIGPAGVQHLYGDESGHVGEVVYLGTAPDNLGDEWYQWDGPDESHDIHVHHIDNSVGHPHAELVDVKAGCHDVLVEYCTDGGGAGRYVLDGNDPTSETAFHLGGREITLRWNVVENSNGQGVEVGSWGVTHREEFEREKGLPYHEDLFDHGRANAIYGNRIVDSAGLAIQYPIVYPEGGEPHVAEEYGPDEQAVVCGNEIEGPTHGNPEGACDQLVPTTERIGHLGGESPWN